MLSWKYCAYFIDKFILKYHHKMLIEIEMLLKHLKANFGGKLKYQNRLHRSVLISNVFKLFSTETY